MPDLPPSTSPLAGSLRGVLDALVASADEVARGVMGDADGCGVPRVREGFARFPAGAHIALIADAPIHVGVGTSLASCERLARVMLALAPDDPIEPPDVGDALAEMANMMAGGVKRRLSAAHPGSLPVVGLPVFIRAAVEPSADLESVVAEVVVAGEPIELFVLRRAPGRERGASSRDDDDRSPT